MGAWRADTLSNDNAADWIFEFLETRDPWQYVRSTLLRTSTETEDATLDERGLAAAEVVSAALGYPALDLDEEVQSAAVSCPGDLRSISADWPLQLQSEFNMIPNLRGIGKRQMEVQTGSWQSKVSNSGLTPVWCLDVRFQYDRPLVVNSALHREM